MSPRGRGAWTSFISKNKPIIAMLVISFIYFLMLQFVNKRKNVEIKF